MRKDKRPLARTSGSNTSNNNDSTFRRQLEAEIQGVMRSTGLGRTAAIAHLLSRGSEQGTSRRAETLQQLQRRSRAANARRSARSAPQRVFDDPLLLNRLAAHAASQYNLARFGSLTKGAHDAAKWRGVKRPPCIVGPSPPVSHWDMRRSGKYVGQLYPWQNRGQWEKLKYPLDPHEGPNYIKLIPDVYARDKYGTLASLRAVLQRLRATASRHYPVWDPWVTVMEGLKMAVNGLLLKCGPSRTAEQLENMVERIQAGLRNSPTRSEFHLSLIDHASQLDYWALYILLYLFHALD